MPTFGVKIVALDRVESFVAVAPAYDKKSLSNDGDAKLNPLVFDLAAVKPLVGLQGVQQFNRVAPFRRLARVHSAHHH